jgi:hypothetical protein
MGFLLEIPDRKGKEDLVWRSVIELSLEGACPAPMRGCIRTYQFALRIKKVEAVDLGAVLKIDEFVNKPDEGTAQKNLDVGNYLCSWGMFLFKEYKESFEDY